jgi:aspartokinase/homoserine dehydrogenase 1
LIDENGVNLGTWQEKLKKAKKMDIHGYIDFIIEKNLRNSVFVDITANEVTAMTYGDLLQKSISVVACNKIACSADYKHYTDLKGYARKHNAKLLYETNVGAALPIIGTLNDFVSSGDEVVRIEAVLSGTLNYVFNEYDTTKSFAEVVKIAQDAGFTEPDPRLDLGGTDVMRKILILARDAGHKLELNDIKNNKFMPAACMKGSVEDFYKETAKHEAHFVKLYEAAKKEDCILKFVATLKDGKASVGLQHIDKAHDMYHLYGKDNIVLFYTNRYTEQPLVIKGAGAGADVTASGIFADIIRAAKG